VTAVAVAAILLVVLTLYATLAGADFGGGFWDLVAGGDEGGRAPRRLIDETITPVWEANHVWLIFALVIFWSAFPTAFAAVMTAAALPIWLAALGIVLRGAGFAFRKEVEGLRWLRLLGVTFALSSVVTPFFMGTVIGAVVTGRVAVDARHTTLAAWTGGSSLLIGALFVAMCSYLAAVYLIGEARSRHDLRLERYFVRRATFAGAVAGALSLAALLELRHSHAALYHGLIGRALPLVLLAAACGGVVLTLLVTGRTSGLRAVSALGVAAVLWGWGVAQYPTLLPGSGLTLSTGSAPHGTLVTLIAIFAAAVLLIGPAFLLLFWLHGRQLLESEDAGSLSARSGLSELGARGATARPAQRVVVVGGGFGGLFATRALRGAHVEVTLVDRHNFHLFQPLAYQVATGALSAAEIAAPLRAVLRGQTNLRVVLAEVSGFDLDRREVILAQLPNGESRGTLAYDTLVVAGGSRYSYFGNDHWHRFAPELKSLAGALEIRSRILGAFEAAEVEQDRDRRRSWLTFVVVGAGPTGVEMAGQIAELARDTLRRDYHAVDTRSARVLLVEATDRILTSFPPSLSLKATRALEHLGVTPLLGHLVVDISAEAVAIRKPDGAVEQIDARTVIWAAGVSASELAAALGKQTGAELDTAGRVTVGPELTLPGHPEVFAIGDMVRVSSADGTIATLPGIAPVAMQQGRYVAALIDNRLRGRNTAPFRYVDKGNLATIGRSKAVADVKGIRIAGFPAWVLWLVVHLFYLIGFQNRLLVVLRWTVSFITRGRGARLIGERV
jgi:NADH dehydrogenase